MPFENKAQTRQVLINPNSFATTLVVCLVDVYGAGAAPDESGKPQGGLLTWAPETIRMQTEEDFGFQWPQANFDRLMAGIAIITQDGFYKSLPDFIELCNILSGAPATPGVFAPADALECAWGVTEALLLAPPDDEEPFTEEIRTYIGKVVEMEGIISPPDILRLGIMSQDHKVRVHNDFSDDPELYGAIWGSEQSKTDEINDIVKGRLTLLVQQLASLNLTNGSTSQIAQKMLTNLNAIPEGGHPL